MSGWVYILANRYRGSTYIGVTADLARRIFQHRESRGSKHAARYGIMRLVYAERHDLIIDAIAREKAIKKWLRDWKIDLIEQANPDWNDLWDTINC